MIGFTYAELLQAMQDWPENAGANYIGNIPRYVEMGELRLVRDLNLEIFDQTDQSFTLLAGLNQVPKPAGLIQLRTMRMALIASTSGAAADPNALCALQGSFANSTALTFNGTLGLAPVTLGVPAQVEVTSDTIGGVSVVVTGFDYQGNPAVETLITVASTLIIGDTVFSQITGITCFNGSTAQTIAVGTAAAAASTAGTSTPVYKRSTDFCQAFAQDPTIVGPPRYYAELNQTLWLLTPSADQDYLAVLRFIKRPQSIVTAGTSWLGDNCGEILFAASLMEAERYLKADDRFGDIQSDYQSKLATARLELRNSIRVGDYSPARPAAVTTQG
jgi:hypothetical protein